MNPAPISTSEYSSNLSIKDKQHSLENRGGVKALVINCSSDYNIAVEKIANWLKSNGHQVVKAQPGNKNFKEFDTVYLSALYTWELPILIQEAKRASLYTKVEIGGPAASVMSSYILNQTGITPKVGLDNRFETESGKYYLTYTSRGCIRNCQFCSVPSVEGKLRENPDFIPASVVLDANFLACSKKHIENACEKLSQLPYIDFLHGLDARLLQPWHVKLILNSLNLVCWRFTFDSLKNESALINALSMLKDYGIGTDNIIIYCIYNFNETPEDAYERAHLIMKQKAHPYAMRFQPLDVLQKDSFIAKPWTVKTLNEFKHFCNIPTLKWLNNQLKNKRLGIKQ